MIDNETLQIIIRDRFLGYFFLSPSLKFITRGGNRALNPPSRYVFAYTYNRSSTRYEISHKIGFNAESVVYTTDEVLN